MYRSFRFSEQFNYFSKIPLSSTQKSQLKLARVPQSGSFRGTKYKTNFYLTAVEHGKTKLYKIIFLVELKLGKGLHIVANEIELKGFDYHFQSYEVGQCLNNLQLKPVDYFTSPPLHLYTSNNGKVYLRNKYL